MTWTDPSPYPLARSNTCVVWDCRELLREHFQSVEGKFELAVSADHQEDGDTTPIEAFLADSVKGNCEGLMLKTLVDDSTYEPSKRCGHDDDDDDDDGGSSLSHSSVG
jgi:hypothetical protein